MARVDVTQETVLKRIVVRLRRQLRLNRSRCYETLEPEAPAIQPVGGGHFVTVAPGDGQFVEGEQAPPNVTEEWSVLVTVYTRIKLDRLNSDQELLRDASRGLLVLKRKILKALVGHDLTTRAGDTFLRQLLFARHCNRPQHDSERHIGWITIEFGVPFDWELQG